MNIKNIRLVKFSDDTYGVRKGWLFHKYYDFVGYGMCDWRSKRNHSFKDCKTSYQSAEEQFFSKTNVEKDEVIK